MSTLAALAAPVPELGRAERAALQFVAPRLREGLAALLPTRPAEAWVEVRLRLQRPVQVVTLGGERWLGPAGAADHPEQAVCCARDDLERTLHLVTRASLYAWEEELAQGFCTLPGGHRVGLAGTAVVRRGVVRGCKAFGGLNLRLQRALPGAADPALPHCAGEGTVRSTLVFGPPGCGKTTLLRDLARQLSLGRADLGLPPRAVTVVDERCELAACSDGVPQLDVGPRTDVLDRCPKAEGLAIAVRALGPRVLVCDEVGGAADAGALADAARCGVAVLASAHARDLDDLWHRPALRRLLAGGAFELALQLGEDRRIRGAFDLRGYPPGRGRPPLGAGPAARRVAGGVLAAASPVPWPHGGLRPG